MRPVGYSTQRSLPSLNSLAALTSHSWQSRRDVGDAPSASLSLDAGTRRMTRGTDMTSYSDSLRVKTSHRAGEAT